LYGKTAGKEEPIEACDGLFDLGASPGDEGRSVDLYGEWELCRCLLLPIAMADLVALRSTRNKRPGRWHLCAGFRLLAAIGVPLRRPGFFGRPAVWSSHRQEPWS